MFLIHKNENSSLAINAIKNLEIAPEKDDFALAEKSISPLKINGNSVRKFLSCPEAIHIPVR